MSVLMCSGIPGPGQAQSTYLGWGDAEELPPVWVWVWGLGQGEYRLGGCGMWYPRSSKLCTLVPVKAGQFRGCSQEPVWGTVPRVGRGADGRDAGTSVCGGVALGAYVASAPLLALRRPCLGAGLLGPRQGEARSPSSWWQCAGSLLLRL